MYLVFESKKIFSSLCFPHLTSCTICSWIYNHRTNEQKDLNPAWTSEFLEHILTYGAGHLPSSCCRLALLTNRAARCCWWDGKALGLLEGNYGISSWGVMCSFCHTNAAQMHVFVVYTHSFPAEDIYWCMSRFSLSRMTICLMSLIFVILLMFSLSISARRCASLSTSQCESQSTEHFPHSKANPKMTPSLGNAVIYLRGSRRICRACFKH